MLAYLQLMTGLAPALRRAAPARIVNVVSELAGGLDMADPLWSRRPYDAVEAYSASKQAELMLTWAGHVPIERPHAPLSTRPSPPGRVHKGRYPRGA